MPFNTHAPKYAAVAAALLWSASAHAAGDPTGVWFDHNGRGAVEIKECAAGTGLCGYVVHIKDASKAKHCGLQILGEVTPGGGGWIYSPERKNKYDVALKRLSDDKLRVVGNAGSRFFSRTYTWNRAPDDIARCSEATAALPAKTDSAGTGPGVVNDASPAPAVSTGTAAATTAPAGPAESTTKAAPAATDTKPAGEATTTAAASDTGAATDESSKRKCKYRIPYIGRTVTVACRD